MKLHKVINTMMETENQKFNNYIIQVFLHKIVDHVKLNIYSIPAVAAIIT